MSQTIYITTNESPSQQVAITVDPSGPMGLSAYQVWLAVGNTGTEQDFLDDLQATQINSDWNATTGVARILNKPILGTASAANTTDFATASQGILASTAVQPAVLNTGLALKVDKIVGKQLSTEDYTTTEKNKLTGIAPGAEVNVNPDWNATSGDGQILNKPTLGTASAANTTDFATASQGILASTAVQPAVLNTGLALKVDKVSGKQLSTEDYTTAEKNKLAGIATGAEVNVNPDWNATSGDGQILNKPTTIGGFGIIDAVVNQGNASAIVCLTKAQYDAIPNPVSTTIYILTD